jgi:hypothetical protein
LANCVDGLAVRVSSLSALPGAIPCWAVAVVVGLVGSSSEAGDSAVLRSGVCRPASSSSPA